MFNEEELQLIAKMHDDFISSVKMKNEYGVKNIKGFLCRLEGNFPVAEERQGKIMAYKII